MKLRINIFSLLLLALAACSTGYHTASKVDDIYYSPKVVRPAQSNEVTYSDATVVEVPKDASTKASDTNAYTNDQAVSEHPYTEYDPDSDYYYLSENQSQPVFDNEGNVYISNNYYGDVYDYAYSSRIRRFYRPMVSSHYYYDPFYTNMYWYNYDPFYSGVSIYMGYGAMPFYYPGYYWNPAFSWRMNWGLGYGWGYDPFFWHHDPFGYSYWRSPYFYSPYSFHSAYRYGFSSGYYMGLYNNPYYYQYIYNSYDRSNYHYGPRGSVGSSTRVRGTGTPETFADVFETRTSRNAAGSREIISRADGRSGVEKADQGSTSRPQRTTTSPDQTVTQPRTATAQPGRQTVRDNEGLTRGEQQTTRQGVADSRPQTRPDAATQTRPDAPATRTGNTTLERPDASTRPDASAMPRPQTTQPATTERPTPRSLAPNPAQRYSRPEQSTPANQTRDVQPNYTPPRTYTSPSYQQPRSTEQFRSPQTTRTPSVTPPAEALPPVTRTRTQPEQQNITPQARPQTTPTRQDRGQPSYSPPSRQPTPTRTTPATRPTSTPSTRPASTPSSSPRSTPSVSPSRSPSPSSSPAPSRSSGGSSPSRSSSGRSGGNR